MEASIKPIADRCAVVTGANKGIGLEIVRQLAREGVFVVLTARNEQRGIQATTSLNESGLSNVVFHQLDVRDSTSVASLAKFIQNRFGKLDILVNNAGVSGIIVDVEGLKCLNVDIESSLSGKPVEGVMQQTYDTAAECLDINYYGCKRVTEGLIPLLKLSTSGARIVNVSSLAGQLMWIPSERTRAELTDITNLTEEGLEELLQRFFEDLKNDQLESSGWPLTYPSYSISKAMLNAYTRILSKRYPSMCINCVHPGFINTDINWNMGTKTVDEGAKGPVMLALLPDGGPSGHYFSETEICDF